MATNITAHIVVEFSSTDADVQPVVEVDDRPLGFNNGKTSFLPGQEAYLLVFVPTGFSITTSLISAGNLAYVQNDTKSVEQTFDFPNTEEQSLQYPFTSDFSYQWVGNPPAGSSSLTVSGQNKVILAPRPRNPLTNLPVPEHQIGIAKVTYKAECQVWKIWGVPGTVDRAMAYFVFTKP